MAVEIGILASLVAPAIEVGKCLKKQFNYLCCLKTNILDLKDAVEEVENARDGLQRRVDVARRNGEVILPVVETWLQRADETGAIKLQIIDPSIPGIWRLKSRYSRSRKAKKRVESMVKLRDSCIFDPISTPSLPAAMVPIALPGGALEFASRKQTEEDIIKAMRGEEVKVIGVCGMGGVGKTMMAKQIMNRAKEKECLFEEVVMVTVGQQADMLKIQRDIAEWLGMKFEEETLAPRANRLRDRLIMSGKRTLIVIDDIWERIDLGSLGIPSESGLCKVFFTTRDRSVLDAQKVFTVNELDEEETWFMFKENAGACVDDSNLSSIAAEIVKECNGLPLALVTVAKALEGEVSKSIWKDALMQLRSGNPIAMPHVIENVYNPIKLSYDFLKNPQAESLLFLCSFFPEDSDISLEKDLLYFSFGLGIYDDINSLEETRDRIATLIKTLKSRFLILDGRDEHHVKVHDVVRDVINFISLEKKQAILQFSSMDCWSRRSPHSDICTMILAVPKGEIIGLPMELSFPTLQLLAMRGTRFELSDGFFKGMQQLKVLCMEEFSFATTPQSMQLLKNLSTLHLCFCMSLETLSAVGELSSLEILICRGCHSITELPIGIGKLKRLIRLEVSNCRSLKTIMPGVISRLVRLEELKMLSSFKGWESDEKGNDKSNASLTELESLCNLKCLEIEIEDWSLASEKIQLSSKIEKYNIFVGEKRGNIYDGTQHHKKILTLNLPMEKPSSLGDWIHTFARMAEKLGLEGGSYQSLDFAGYTQNMSNKRCLSIAGGSEVEKFRVFPILETLNLLSLPNLEEIFYDQISDGSTNSFTKLSELEFINLGEIYISKCGKLQSLFSSLALIKSLSQLQTLVISECDTMEEVFSMELEEKDYGKSACITFPKLESLSLDNLPRLTTFCKGINGIINIEFPRLNDLRISDCPKLISFINTGAAAVSDENHMNSSSAAHVHLFCNTKQQDVTLTFGSLNDLSIGGYENDISYLWCHHIPHLFFAGLNQLHIWKCGNIQNLFSYSIVENLVNLKTLYIGQCNEMVYVIGDDVNTETTSQTNPQILIFHKLEVLKLFSLPKLQIFSQGKWDLQFPSLERLDVHECPLLGSLSTTNLEDSCSAHPDNVHLFCNTKITFGRLEYLQINGYENDIRYLWRPHIPHHFFDKLETLEISRCAHVHNLFSYSIAGNLVNLKTLVISGCNEMIYVIADDITTETSETNLQITFHKLEKVSLKILPELQIFCEGKCDLQFPSLKRVEILECPRMEGFTMGSVSTPRMKMFEIDGQKKNVEDLIKYPWQQL